MTLEIVLGTKNVHKAYEMNLIAKPFNVRFVLVNSEDFNPDETADSFEGNALIKAQKAAELDKGRLFMADDSGLCVDFLNGAPGVKSARYADTSEKRIEKLLNALENVDNRKAHFMCSLVLVDENGAILHKTEGVCKGEIGFSKKGKGGFGYDPVFIVNNLDKTMAELTEDEKNLHSHRGRALLDMLVWLKCTHL